MEPETSAYERAQNDYVQNFSTRIQIKEKFTFEEIKEILRDAEYKQNPRIAWRFNFYLKQVFLSSLKQILSVAPMGDQTATKKFLAEITEMVAYHYSDEIRSVVLFQKLSLFIGEIEEYHLQDAFKGVLYYDTCCAQIAYNEYMRRRKD